VNWDNAIKVAEACGTLLLGLGTVGTWFCTFRLSAQNRARHTETVAQLGQIKDGVDGLASARATLAADKATLVERARGEDKAEAVADATAAARQV